MGNNISLNNHDANKSQQEFFQEIMNENIKYIRIWMDTLSEIIYKN